MICQRVVAAGFPPIGRARGLQRKGNAAGVQKAQVSASLSGSLLRLVAPRGGCCDLRSRFFRGRDPAPIFPGASRAGRDRRLPGAGRWAPSGSGLTGASLPLLPAFLLLRVSLSSAFFPGIRLGFGVTSPPFRGLAHSANRAGVFPAPVCPKAARERSCANFSGG